MTKTTAIVREAAVERLILMIRGERVLLDSDLAALYGVSTKRVNEQVRRNRARFPGDFMFQLTAEEKAEVVAKCDHLTRLKFSPTRPYAFTEQGVAMLSSVLNSPRAVKVNIEIMRAFVRLRQILSAHADLARKLDALERKYDSQFKVVFDAIRQLMTPPAAKTKRIGFKQDEC